MSSNAFSNVSNDNQDLLDEIEMHFFKKIDRSQPFHPSCLQCLSISDDLLRQRAVIMLFPDQREALTIKKEWIELSKAEGMRKVLNNLKSDPEFDYLALPDVKAIPESPIHVFSPVDFKLEPDSNQDSDNSAANVLGENNKDNNQCTLSESQSNNVNSNVEIPIIPTIPVVIKQEPNVDETEESQPANILGSNNKDDSSRALSESQSENVIEDRSGNVEFPSHLISPVEVRQESNLDEADNNNSANTFDNINDGQVPLTLSEAQSRNSNINKDGNVNFPIQSASRVTVKEEPDLSQAIVPSQQRLIGSSILCPIVLSSDDEESESEVSPPEDPTLSFLNSGDDSPVEEPETSEENIVFSSGESPSNSASHPVSPVVIKQEPNLDETLHLSSFLLLGSSRNLAIILSSDEDENETEISSNHELPEMESESEYSMSSAVDSSNESPRPVQSTVVNDPELALRALQDILSLSVLEKYNLLLPDEKAVCDKFYFRQSPVKVAKKKPTPKKKRLTRVKHEYHSEPGKNSICVFLFHIIHL